MATNSLYLPQEYHTLHLYIKNNQALFKDLLQKNPNEQAAIIIEIKDGSERYHYTALLRASRQEGKGNGLNRLDLYRETVGRGAEAEVFERIATVYPNSDNPEEILCKSISNQDDCPWVIKLSSLSQHNLNQIIAACSGPRKSHRDVLIGTNRRIRKNFENELKILNDLGKDYIRVKKQLIIIPGSPNKYGIVMEKLGDFDLFALLAEYSVSEKPEEKAIADELTLDKRQAICIELLKCLELLASKDYSHGDIKPENCVIDWASGRVRLVDMSYARKGGCKFYSAFKGTLEYAAPEVIKHFKTTHETDVYSAALICWAFLLKPRAARFFLNDLTTRVQCIRDQKDWIQNGYRGTLPVFNLNKDDLLDELGDEVKYNIFSLMHSILVTGCRPWAVNVREMLQDCFNGRTPSFLQEYQKEHAASLAAKVPSSKLSVISSAVVKAAVFSNQQILVDETTGLLTGKNPCCCNIL